MSIIPICLLVTSLVAANSGVAQRAVSEEETRGLGLEDQEETPSSKAGTSDDAAPDIPSPKPGVPLT